MRQVLRGAAVLMLAVPIGLGGCTRSPDRSGPKTIAIKTAPAILKPQAVEKLLVELLDGLERETQVVNIDALKKKIAATVSCHAAIKINMPLDETKMRWLVNELMKTDVPTVCPHGRPIILRYDLREIEKAFKRA